MWIIRILTQMAFGSSQPLVIVVEPLGIVYVILSEVFACLVGPRLIFVPELTSIRIKLVGIVESGFPDRLYTNYKALQKCGSYANGYSLIKIYYLRKGGSRYIK